MCLFRHAFPSGTAFPWQKVSSFPIVYLLEARKDEKAKDSKLRAEGVPGKFPGINH